MGATAGIVMGSLRHRWRAVVGLAIVVGLVGGVALAALAGARRTASAFPRYLEASNATDIAVDVFPIADDEEETIDATLQYAEAARLIEGVVGDASYVGIASIFPLVDGVVPDDIIIETVGSFDGRYFDSDRVVVSDGRLPRQDRVGEVFLNESAAAMLRVSVGDEVVLGVFERFDTLGQPLRLVQQGLGDPRSAPMAARERTIVTGIGLFADEVVSDDFDRAARLLTTPALTQRYYATAATYYWQGLHLRPGTDVEATIAAYRALVDDDHAVIVKRTDQEEAAVQRAVRPLVIALGMFGALALAAAVALGSFAALRMVNDRPADARTLRALGLGPRHLLATLAGPPVAGALVGAATAVLLAIVLSPLAPFGTVRSADPSPGVDLDLTVLGAGAAVLVLVIGAVAATAGRSVLRARQAAGAARSRVTDVLVAAGASPAALIGAQHALRPDADGGRVPTRSTLAACAVALAAMSSALVFAINVRALVEDPPRFGWATDLAVSSDGGYEYLDPHGAASVARDPAVTGLSIAGFSPIEVAGTSVNVIGIMPIEGRPPVTVVSGRLPEADDEVALGAVTARQLGAARGDTVVTGSGAELEVTGIVALPAVGQTASGHPSLGQGATMVLDGLRALNPGAYPVMALVQLADATTTVEADRIKELVATDASPLPPGFASVYRDLRPADIVALTPAGPTVLGLAGVLAVAAVLALAITVNVSVRRRVGTFATLRALGFEAAQVRAAVRWQANTTLAGGLLVGAPIGVAIGRRGWIGLADTLGTTAAPVVPLAPSAGLLVALVVIGNLAVVRPARRAALAPAHALHAER